MGYRVLVEQYRRQNFHQSSAVKLTVNNDIKPVLFPSSTDSSATLKQWLLRVLCSTHGLWSNTNKMLFFFLQEKYATDSLYHINKLAQFYQRSKCRKNIYRENQSFLTKWQRLFELTQLGHQFCSFSVFLSFLLNQKSSTLQHDLKLEHSIHKQDVTRNTKSIIIHTVVTYHRYQTLFWSQMH